MNYITIHPRAYFLTLPDLGGSQSESASLSNHDGKVLVNIGYSYCRSTTN